jgi:hypothetical protein
MRARKEKASIGFELSGIALSPYHKYATTQKSGEPKVGKNSLAAFPPKVKINLGRESREPECGVVSGSGAVEAGFLFHVSVNRPFALEFINVRNQPKYIERQIKLGFKLSDRIGHTRYCARYYPIIS